MLYDYTDEYLEITEKIEAEAVAEISQFKFTNDFFIKKLTILKAYIICCLTNQTQESDLYEIKLKHYKSEFETTLNEAKQDKAQTQAEKNDKNSYLTKFNAPLYRG